LTPRSGPVRSMLARCRHQGSRPARRVKEAGASRLHRMAPGSRRLPRRVRSGGSHAGTTRPGTCGLHLRAHAPNRQQTQILKGPPMDASSDRKVIASGPRYYHRGLFASFDPGHKGSTPTESMVHILGYPSETIAVTVATSYRDACDHARYAKPTRDVITQKTPRMPNRRRFGTCCMSMPLISPRPMAFADKTTRGFETANSRRECLCAIISI